MSLRKDIVDQALEHARQQLLKKSTPIQQKQHLDHVIDILKLIKHEQFYQKDNLKLSAEMVDRLINGNVNVENVLDALESLHTYGSDGKHGKPKEECSKTNKRKGVPITTQMLEILINHSKSTDVMVSAFEMIHIMGFPSLIQDKIMSVIQAYPAHATAIAHSVGLLEGNDELIVVFLSQLNDENIKNCMHVANALTVLEDNDVLTPGMIEMVFAEPDNAKTFAQVMQDVTSSRESSSLKLFAPKPVPSEAKGVQSNVQVAKPGKLEVRELVSDAESDSDDVNLDDLIFNEVHKPKI